MANEQSGLERQLGLFDSSMVVVGVVIGAGIFITTGIMAKGLPSAYYLWKRASQKEAPQ